jgi:hypothetical protein
VGGGGWLGGEEVVGGTRICRNIVWKGTLPMTSSPHDSIRILPRSSDFVLYVILGYRQYQVGCEGMGGRGESLAFYLRKLELDSDNKVQSDFDKRCSLR